MNRRQFFGAAIGGTLLSRFRGTAAIVNPGDPVGPAIAAGKHVQFNAGDYDIANLTVPVGTRLDALGPVILHVSGTGLTLLDDVIIGPGFTFDAVSPSTFSIGVRVAGKRTQLYGPRFNRFGNQVSAVQPLASASYGLVYDSLDPATWADWNHLYSPHFEFCYGGLLLTSPSNVMVSNLVARGKIGPGGAVRSHMSGNPAGCPVRINGIWTAHCEAAAIQFTKDASVTREGGNIVSNWTNEPGAGRPGTAAQVDSDGNIFTGAISLVGGSVGFAWGAVSGNVVDSVVKRVAQGGVGPPVDTGPVANQIYST